MGTSERAQYRRGRVGMQLGRGDELELGKEGKRGPTSM